MQRRTSNEVASRAGGLTKDLKRMLPTVAAQTAEFNRWHLGAMRKEAVQKGLQPLDEETARHEHLRAAAAAPDLATVKRLFTILRRH